MLLFVRTLSRVVVRAPVVVVLAVLVATGGFAVLSTQAETAAGNEGFAPDNPELEAAEALSEHFGATGEEVVQILVRSESGDVISGNGVRAVTALREAVTDSPAGEHIADREDRPGIVSFLDPALMAAEQSQIPPGQLADQTVQQLYTESLAQLSPQEAGFVTGLLPQDADATQGDADAGLMLVFLDTGHLQGDGTEQFDALIELETQVADAVRGADLPFQIDAEPFSFALLFADDGAFQAEIGRLFAAAFLIIIVILGFVYWLRPGLGLTRLGASRRTVADALLTMLTIVMAITWMNGIAVLLGPDYLGLIGRMTEVTQIIPVLMIGLGVDYSIHLTSRYREEVGSGAATTREAIARAVHTVGVALVLATMTTAVGFLTNWVNPVPALKDFGIIAAVGIVSAFVLMLTFVPAVRLLLDRRAEAAGRLPAAALGRTTERVLPGIMARTAVLAERAPIPTLVVTVVLGGALGLWGLSALETRFSMTDFVADDSPVVQTFDRIAEDFDGGFGEQTEVLVRGDIATPEVHNAIVQVQDDLADVDDVALLDGRAQVESPVSVLAQLTMPGPDGTPGPLAEQAAAAGMGQDLRVDADADVAALYAAMLDAAPQRAGRVLADGDGDLAMARLGIQTNAGEDGAAQLRATLRDALAPIEATGASAVATSNPIINDVIVRALQDSQVSSLLVTLLAAMVLLVITFWVQSRRPLLGVLTIAPVALVVLWTFGMMAATGIPFGPVTATIAALAIGIGVPYSIHITHRYQEDRMRIADPHLAIRSTVRHTGGALAGSAFTTMAGFGVLVTSSLTPFRQFGLVTAYAIGFALLAATIVLPSMLALWDRWHRSHRPAPVEQSPSVEEPAAV
ncbi:MAG TPA: MMPL family transporter [Egibacteraceae bacterium]|nr:MMPL family transporter [Egibacteraceae bacterium]